MCQEEGSKCPKHLSVSTLATLKIRNVPQSSEKWIHTLTVTFGEHSSKCGTKWKPHSFVLSLLLVALLCVLDERVYEFTIPIAHLGI